MPPMTTTSDISARIWDMKYRFKAADGTPIDRDVAGSWARVALALAAAEPAETRNAHAKSLPGRWRGTNSCRPGASWPGPAPNAA